MKRILLILPLIALLSACQSKKEICARWAAGQWEYYSEVQKSLGLDENGDVRNYCSYYQN